MPISATHAIWLIHVACACVYLSMAVLVVARRPRASLNQACAGLILCFAFWSACLAVSHHPDSSLATAIRFYSVGSLAWGTFASLSVLFIAAFWRPTLLRSRLFWAALALPPVFVISAQWSGRLAASYPVRPWGYGYVWRDAFPAYFFIAYYTLYMTVGLGLLFVSSKNAAIPVRRRQARIIVLSAIVPLFTGSLSDVALPHLGINVVPNMAPDFTVIWVLGLVYAIVRYRMLELTPAVAADRVVETMPDALFLVDPDGRISWANPAAMQLFDCPLAKLKEMTLSQLLGAPLPRNQLLRTGRRDVSVVRKPSNVTAKIDPPSSESTEPALEISLSFGEVHGSLDELVGWVCVATDITARNQTQAELRRARDTMENRVAGRTQELQKVNGRLVAEISERRRSEEHYRLLIESMHEGVCVLDAEDKITLVNSRLAETLEHPADELGGRQLAEFVHDSSANSSRRTMQSARAGKSGQGDWKLRGRDDRQIHAIVHVAPLRDGLGQYSGSVLTVMDVTEREHMRAQLARAERLASMGLLAAGVGHEINNPLTYLSGNLEEIGALAAGSVNQNALTEIGARAREAMDGARRVRDIVRELRRFSRSDSAETSPVNVHDAIDDAIRLSHNEVRFRARLVREFSPGRAPIVTANRTNLSQVFLNLLLNASQAIAEGNPDDNEIRVRSWSDGREVFVRVSDTGAGISPDHLDHIFDPFFSTKTMSDGQGLGLAICHEIVVALGGRIGVDSQLGRGSQFVVSLPEAPVTSESDNVDAPEPAPAQAPAETVAKSGGPSESKPAPVEAKALAVAPAPSISGTEPVFVSKPSVLIVDDESLIRRVLVRQLSARFEIVDVGSGAEAKEAISRHQFDLVFCDLMMPGVSGMALSDWIAENVPELSSRIIFMTGGAFTPQAERYLANSRNPVLEKPFQPAEALRIAVDTIERRKAHLAPSDSGGIPLLLT